MRMKKEEGVSPVIATILLVAITVVLVATLMMMLPSVTPSNTSLIGTLTYDRDSSEPTKAVFIINLQQPTQAKQSAVIITCWDDNGTQNTSVTTSIQDVNGNGVVDSGDRIIVESTYTIPTGFKVYVSISGYSGNIEGVVPP